MPTRESPDGRPSELNTSDQSRVAEPSASFDQEFAAYLFDVSPVPAVVSRLADHTVLAVNRRIAEMFGVRPSEAIGLKVTDYYVDPSDRQTLIDRLRRDGRADNIRVQLKGPNGEPFWAQSSVRLFSYHGEPAVFAMFHDISDQIAAEQALRASEQRLTAQSDALTSLTARYANLTQPFADRLRDILSVSAQTLNTARLSMWRFDEESRSIICVDLYRSATDEHESGAVLPRDAAPAYFQALERDRVIAACDAATDPRTREFLDSYLRPYGIGAMLDVPLRQNNKTIGVVCAEHIGGPRVWTVDEQNFAISTANLIAVALADEDLRGALARLAESETRARLIVDTAHDAFVGVNSAGKIVSWNAQAERTFGWTCDEAIGRSLADTIIPMAFRDAHLHGMKRFHETGEAPVLNKTLELTALHRTGREFPIEITITSPIPTAKGYFFGAFLRDISTRRDHEEQLRRARDTAEAATRAKSEFLANMSHELRTPLNGVLGYAQLLQRDRSLSATQKEALDAISVSGSHLLDLINDVLDFSKIEAGFLDIEEVPTDLAQLVVDLKYVVGEAARRKGVLLTTAIDPDLPRRVVLDGRHLRQVLLNLLGNAIKFTARGEVRLVIGATDAGRLSFEVSDTGIGIEPEALTAIFGTFTQTRAGATAGGTGLGLAISHHLVRKMGDELRVESVRGEGSRFFFSLPLVSATARTERDDQTAAPPLDAKLMPGQDLTALVADDHTVNRRILAALLQSAGVRVITAAGGLEAIQLARENHPDVIFMDLKMTDLDGLEATRRLRADPATERIPVIAVTASAHGDARVAAREAGCIDYLPKPVRAEALFATLQTHLGVTFVGRTAEPTTSHAEADVLHGGRPEIGRELHAAAAIGDVTALEALAQQLVSENPTSAALGHRISRLVANFDFEALRDLASSLSIEETDVRAGN